MWSFDFGPFKATESTSPCFIYNRGIQQGIISNIGGTRGRLPLPAPPFSHPVVKYDGTNFPHLSFLYFSSSKEILQVLVSLIFFTPSIPPDGGPSWSCESCWVFPTSSASCCLSRVWMECRSWSSSESSTASFSAIQPFSSSTS